LNVKAGAASGQVRLHAGITVRELTRARRFYSELLGLEEIVDRELLGGFVAEIGSVLVDGSLDGQLARVRERLVKGQA